MGADSCHKEPSVIFVQYPSLYNSDAPYAIPIEKIGISVLSMAKPYEIKCISSLVEQVYKDVDSVNNINRDKDHLKNMRRVVCYRTREGKTKRFQFHRGFRVLVRAGTDRSYCRCIYGRYVCSKTQRNQEDFDQSVISCFAFNAGQTGWYNEFLSQRADGATHYETHRTTLAP